MPISAPGSSLLAPLQRRAQAGFTLIELMVVLAIVALGAGLLSLAIPDPAATRLETDAARLVALLETARTEARAGGFNVVWVPAAEAGAEPFRFAGLPQAMALPTHWLDDRVSAQVLGGASNVVLGPEAILPPQRVLLRLQERQLTVGSDGIGAFAVLPAETP
jgi:general secretion pathway protein H